MPSSIVRCLLSISILLVLAPGTFAQDAKLTFEQTLGRGDRVDFRGRTPNWRWAPDGLHLLDPEGKWVDPRTGRETKAPETETNGGAGDDRDARKKAIVADLARLKGVDEKRAEKIAGRRRGTSEDGAATVYVYEGQGYFHRAEVGARTIDLPPGFELGDLSSDGRWFAYVYENDLHVTSTDTGAARALTTDGDRSVFNGKLDWVYQEEVYGRGDFKAFWWNPAGTHVAFLSLDESQVFGFTVIDHIERDTYRVKPEITHYPKAGDPNPTVRFGIVEVATGKTVWADLTSYEADEPLVVRVTWTPGGERALFVVQDRIQQWADLNECDPATGEWRTMIHEENDSWTNRPSPPRWLADGTFLWFSDRTDHRHLYHYREDGALIRAVTSGDWSFGRVIELDEEKGILWFTSTKDGAVNGNVYRIGLDGRGMKRLTSGEGQHSITFNEDRSWFIDRYSSLAVPPSVRLCKGDGKVVRELGTASIPDREKYLTSDWELHEVEARDGFPLDVAVLEPVPFDKRRSYPVWISTYSGPNAPSVRNRWRGRAWNQFLAQQGFVQLQVNVRSASGKGHHAIEQCYKQLGVSELRDLEDAVDWLCANRWADASRVGITGGSYGGFMTAFALTHSDRFALGIAGSGVYDWGMYDTIYTERYMSTPQLNPDGYKAGSVIEAAKDLKGHLLITHGIMDDNVHVQNAIQLVYALQKAGKQNFELMLYPQSRHGIGNAALRAHNRTLEWNTMREHLLDVDP